MLKLFFTLTFTWMLMSSDAFAFVILIDPGHGGKELGAVSRIVVKNKKGKKKTVKVYEKDLCLKLAKLVKKKLDRKFSTYLTRSFDRTVPLQARSAMADTVKADLFISIHFNSTTNRKSHGFETYYLDNHRDKAVKKVEDIENKSLHGDEITLNKILIDLAISKTVDTSKKLARSIHKQVSKQVKKRYQLRDRGVKPGLFYVLALTKRPAVLIEAGFMSHPKEIWKVRSNNFLEKYATGIANGVIEYHKTLPKKEVPLF